MNFVKKTCNYIQEKLSITITPSAKYKIKTFKISRLSLLLIIIVLLLSIITPSYLFVYYQNNYLELKQKANQRVTQLKNLEKENIKYKDINKQIKNELYTLMENTEEVKNQLENLRGENKRIRDLIYNDEKTENKVQQEKVNENDTINEKETENEADNENGNELDKLIFELELTSLINKKDKEELFLPVLGDFSLNYINTEEIIEKARNNIKNIRSKIPQQKQVIDDLETLIIKYNKKRAATPCIWPVLDDGEGFISSSFGWRDSPISGEREFHEGLDIGVWYDTPVVATAKGEVTFVGWKTGYGKTVDIDHGFGYTTRYAHLNKIKVDKGEIVSRGQIVALSGNTGRSTGPHLHYEVRVNNIPKNPQEFIGGIENVWEKE
jgi:murein DD-endopeptidase MepM/ murein hydrolase activator NlpD